jgi:hypothetical protein
MHCNEGAKHISKKLMILLDIKDPSPPPPMRLLYIILSYYFICYTDQSLFAVNLSNKFQQNAIWVQKRRIRH